MTEYNTAITFTGMSEDLKKAETAIRKHLKGFVEFGDALNAVNNPDVSLYKERGFKSFELYCDVMFDITRETAYKAMRAATTYHLLEKAGFKGSDLPTNESQCRPIAVKELTDDQKVNIWSNMIQSVKASNGRITQSLVVTHVALFLKPEPKKLEPVVTPPASTEPTTCNQLVTPAGTTEGTTDEKTVTTPENLPFNADPKNPVVVPAVTHGNVAGAISGAGESVSELKAQISVLKAQKSALESELRTARLSQAKPTTSKLFKEVIRAGLDAIRDKVATPEHKAELANIQATYLPEI